jgi:hypothetical protein
LIVAGVGWLYYATKLDKYPIAAPVVAALCASLAAVAGYVGIRLLLKPPPGLIIDREGIVPNPRRPADRVLWSDLKGAHLAEVRTGAYYGPFLTVPQKAKIVALDLVDPQTFHKRRAAGKRPWLGYDTGVRSDYFPIYYAGLYTDVNRLMYIIKEGIARNGHLALDANPQRTYRLYFP